MGKILLVGDSCLDEFVYGSCSRLCPDVPAQVLDEEKIVQNGGMTMNVFNNILSLGGLADKITNDNWAECKKTRLCAEPSNYILCRWDKKVKVNRIEGLDKIDYSQYDIIACSDYNKGYLLIEDIQYLAAQGKPLFLDTKKRITKEFECCTFIKVNHSEYTASKEFLTPVLEEKIIETIGAKGCRYQDELFPVEELEVRSVSGAGDSFFAGLLVNYLKTQDIREAIRFANRVASIVITKKGVSTVSLSELEK